MEGAFSPRIHPRPAYPPSTAFVYVVFKEVFVQAGLHGPLACLALFSLYTRVANAVLPYLRNRIPAALDPDALFFTLCVSVVHTLLWALCNFSFLAFDRCNLLRRYKIERKGFEVAGAPLMSRMFADAAVSQLVTGPILAYALYPVARRLGMGAYADPLPPFLTMSTVFVVSHVANAFGFYWTHRALHHRALYKLWHKKHHEFKGTVGFAAEFAHPVEVALSNQLPTLAGALLCGTHPLCVFVWLAFRLQQTYEAHSGFCFQGALLNGFPFFLLHAEAAAHHDHHHTTNLGNFGGYTDWIFGTQDHYCAIGGEDGYLKSRRAEK